MRAVADPIILSATYDTCLWSLRTFHFYSDLYLKTLQESFRAISENKSERGGLYEIWLALTDSELERELRSEQFMTILANLIDSGIELRKRLRESGYPIFYLDWTFDVYVRSSMIFASLARDHDSAAFDIVWTRGKTRLLHYHPTPLTSTRSVEKVSKRTPLLIVYAPINRFHIMDMNPDKSVVRNLISHGIDVYLLDWGVPDVSDDNASLSDYMEHVKRAVETIRNETDQMKVSILGYCWGGIFSLSYSALNKESVKNLILMAQPVDFSKDSTILATWARAIDVDRVIDEFGHLDGALLDLGFLMRNPPRYTFDKYLKFFQKASDPKFVETFLGVERWLHDTPMIPGKLYRQIVNDCYKKNLIVAGQLTVDNNGKKDTVDLKKIDMPILTIVAEQDDLVSPESTIAVNQCVLSKDKTVLRVPGGHVGLCISSYAHARLWPEVSRWLLSR